MQAYQHTFSASFSPPTVTVRKAHDRHEVWNIETDHRLPLLAYHPALFGWFYGLLFTLIGLVGCSAQGTMTAWRPITGRRNQINGLSFSAHPVLENSRLYPSRPDRRAFWVIPWESDDFFLRDSETHNRRLLCLFPQFDPSEVIVNRNPDGTIRSLEIKDVFLRDLFNLIQVLVPGLFALVYEESRVVRGIGLNTHRRMRVTQYMPTPEWIAAFWPSITEYGYPALPLAQLQAYALSAQAPDYHLTPEWL